MVEKMTDPRDAVVAAARVMLKAVDTRMIVQNEWLVPDGFYDLRAALAALDAAPSGWLPIESAPKISGKPILAIDGFGHEVVFWGPYAKAWMTGKGNGSCEPQPTHWRPLPLPPETSHD